MFRLPNHSQRLIRTTLALLDEHEELVLVGGMALLLAYDLPTFTHDADFHSTRYEQTAGWASEHEILAGPDGGYLWFRVNGCDINVVDAESEVLGFYNPPLKNYYVEVNGLRTIRVEAIVAAKLLKVAHYLAPSPDEGGYFERYNVPKQVLDVLLVLDRCDVDAGLVHEILEEIGAYPHVERLRHSYMAEPMHYAYALGVHILGCESRDVKKLFMDFISSVV